jgi:ATP-dependent exoDNAse (exonuclease V) beta subunit
MTDKKFKIYSSSAGSGKTYTLTKEYLKLALQSDNPHYFKNILAITFTNDAANEMKERIVNALQSFAYPQSLSAKELAKSEDFLQKIAQEIDTEPEIVRKRAEKTFAKILYNYADFAVSTIDKFVNKVTNAFTRELEIPYNYEVDLDTEQLLQSAVDRVMEKVGRESKEHLSDFVIDWVNQKAEEGKNWGRIAGDLVDFASNLMNESAYPFLAQLKHLAIEDYKALFEQVKGELKNHEKAVIDWAKAAYTLILKSGINFKDFHYGEKGIPGYFKNHFEKYEEQILKTYPNYSRDAIEKDKWASGKGINPQIEAIKGQLTDYIEKIEAYKEKQKSDIILKKAIFPHIYKLALIQEIEAELAEVKRENNSIHISDTNKKIAEIIAYEPVPYIYERVGEKFHHILIDEFQDTSVLQWQNLLPLVENGLSEGYFNLIVGDAKQAIYRWRGGEMEQLVYLYKNKIKNLVGLGESDSPFLLDRYDTIARNANPQNLNYNFRSTQEVIEFNNDFFQELVNTDFGKKYPLLPLIYDEDFAQQVPNPPKTGGHIEIEFLEKGDLYREQTHEKVLSLIQKLKQEGWNYGDMAVLTRSNNNGRELAKYLKEKGIEVVSQDSLSLASDEKVRFLAAFLKVIHKPEDKLAKSEAMYLFYKVIKREIPNPQKNVEIQEVLNKSIIAFYEKLNEEGYPLNYLKLNSLNLYELVERLLGTFGLLQNQNKLEFVFRFLDVILQFNLQKQSTLGDFLEYWEEKKESLSINATPNPQAVIVTSIHKSKGLEYPIVIVPFADWSFTPRTGSTMWVDIREAAFWFFSNQENYEKILPVALVNLNKDLENSILAQQYLDEMEKMFIENVNMLYVAFTRPIYRLYVISRMESFDKESGQKSIAYLIYLYLLLKDKWNPDVRQYCLKEGILPNLSPPETEDNIFYIEEFISTEVHKKLKRKGKKGK